MVLFNFGEEDFVANMGDKIAQLMFEKIETPAIKEVNELGEIGRGNKGYGSKGMSADKLDLIQDLKTKNASSDQNPALNQAVKTKTMNEVAQR